MLIKNIKNILMLLFLSMSSTLFSQNVGINTSGATPSTNAILDLNTGNSNNLGLIIPHVTLAASLSSFNPPIAHSNTAADKGMLVYNSNAVNGNAVGFYYWNGAIWVAVTSASGGGNISPCGSAAQYYVPYFQGISPDVICNSVIYESASNKVGMGIPNPSTTPPYSTLDIYGALAVGGAGYSGTSAPANGMIVQGTVGVDTTAPSSSAILDVNSTKMGLLIPEVTSTTAIASPVNGLVIYNTSTQCFQFYSTGSPAEWSTVACGCTSAPSISTITSNSPICSSGSLTLSVPITSTATTYSWTAPASIGGTITGNGSPSITVSGCTAGTGTFSVTASNACGSSVSATQTVTVYSGSPTATSLTAANSTYCTSDVVTINAPANYTGITWSAPTTICSAAVITAANAANATSITMYGGTGGTGTVTATLTNSCGSINVSTSVTCTNSPITLDNAVIPEEWVNAFTITTSNANEMVVVLVNGASTTSTSFTGSVAVSGGAGPTATQLINYSNKDGTDYFNTAMYAFPATTATTYTITVTETGNTWVSNAAIALTGFCTTPPTVAANVLVQSTTTYTTEVQGSTLSNTISPTVAGSYVIANFYNLDYEADDLAGADWGSMVWTSPAGNVVLGSCYNIYNYADFSFEGYSDATVGTVTCTVDDQYTGTNCVFFGNMQVIDVHN